MKELRMKELRMGVTQNHLFKVVEALETTLKR
jgi:hypothetical protein